MKRSGEFDLIDRYFAPLSADGAFGLKDDAALFTPPMGENLVLTHDTIIEGVHFLPDDPPHTIARKALRVNLSDLFAKGALPLGYTLSLGLPDHFGDDQLSPFSAGLARDQQEFNLKLYGGDTYRSPERLCIGVSMIGQTRNGCYVSRLTAKAGDIVAVTGTIGNGALGLDVLQRKISLTEASEDRLTQLYRVPEPLAANAEIVAEFATASMDVSDGLLGDLGKLCAASGVSAKVDRDAVPLSQAGLEAVNSNSGLWQRVLTGGDDYEVLFTLKPDHLQNCIEAASSMGTSVTAIGRIEDGPAGVVTLEVDGEAVDYGTASFSHF